MGGMELYLIRHAEVELGADGLYPEPAELSARGHEQAERLARRLAGLAPDLLVTSGALRADQTAAPLARACGLQPHMLPGLDEIGIGELREQPRHVRDRRLTERPFRMDFSEFGGESPAEFSGRVIEALEGDLLPLVRAGRRVVTVAHAGSISVILDHLELGAFSGVGLRHIENTSVTLLRAERGGAVRVVYAGDATHMAEEAGR